MLDRRGRRAGRARARGRRGRRRAPTTTSRPSEVRGVLEITRQRYGFLRLDGPRARRRRRLHLRRPGPPLRAAPRRRGRRARRASRAAASATARSCTSTASTARSRAAEVRPDFDALAPVLPERRDRRSTTTRDDVLVRAVDLLAPLALGQRVLVRAAPRSGRTTLLRALARAAVADGNARVIVLLIDERPEEATALARGAAGRRVRDRDRRPRPGRAGADRRAGARARPAAGRDRRGRGPRLRLALAPRLRRPAASTRSSACSAPGATSPAAAR